MFQWILTGASEHQIKEAIDNAWPGQEAQPLIVAAVDELRKSGDFETGVIRGWCFEASRDLYRKMTEIGDFAGALRAVKQILQMAGRE